MTTNLQFLSLLNSYPSDAEIRELNLYLDSPEKIRSFFSSIKFDFDRLLSDILNCELSGHAPFWKTSSRSDICTICISHYYDTDLYFCGDLCFEFGYDEDVSDQATSVNLISFDADFSCRCC